MLWETSSTSPTSYQARIQLDPDQRVMFQPTALNSLPYKLLVVLEELVEALRVREVSD